MKPAWALAAILLVGMVTPIGAQTPPDTVWTRTYGGALSDQGTSVQQTTDGGFIIAGSTNSFGSDGADIWLVKTDDGGVLEWARVFGGGGDDHASFVEQTSDSGYIVTGLSKSFGNGKEDIWLIKTDDTGIEEWNKIFGGPEDDRAQSVRETSDGGYVLAGGTGDYLASGQDVWMIKTDARGDEVWNRTHGGAGNEKAYLVQETTGGGYVLGGNTDSYGNGLADAWLLKTDENGHLLWDKTFGGSAFDNAYYTLQTADSGYVLAGYTRSFGSGDYDVWLIKTDENGDEEWNMKFGESGDEVAYAVQQTAGGNYILAGLTNSFGAAGFDALLIKTDSDGNEIWSDTFGGPSDDYVFSVDQTTDGGYIAAGYTYSFGDPQGDLYAVRLDSDEAMVPVVVASFDSRWNGCCVEIDWRLTDLAGDISFVAYRHELSHGSMSRIEGELISMDDMRFVFRDRNAQRGKNYTYRVVVIEDGEAVASFETTVGTPALGVVLGQNLPNPFNASTQIDFTVSDNQSVTLEVFDIAGKRVRTLMERSMSPGEYTAHWNGCNSAGARVASGIYIFRLTSGKHVLTRKSILLR